jgi:predicted glycosyltransferase
VRAIALHDPLRLKEGSNRKAIDVKKKRRLKMVYYAINGTGLGHLTRQLNIARDVETLATRLGIPVETEILTTSDANHVAREYPVIKIPSKTTVKERGLSTRRYAARARLFVGNYLSGFQPDVLVVDTDPRGSFHEMYSVRGFAKSMVLVDRHKDEAVAARESFKANAELFDLIVVPENDAPHLEGNRKARTVGKIQGFLPERAMSRDAVRRYYGISPQERFIYLSGGGGGDPTLKESIDNAIRALADLPNTVVLVGYGPLYQGEMFYGRRNVIPTQSPALSSHFAGFDLAISAGGYNSHEELLAACVPTLFYAQTKGMDRQDLRIEGTRERGWCGVVESWEAETLQQQVERFLSGEAATVRSSLLKRGLPMGNVHAARHVLRLVLGRQPYSMLPSAVDEVAEELIAERVAACTELFSTSLLSQSDCSVPGRSRELIRVIA